MHYLLGFDVGTQSLVWFEIFETSTFALQRRFELEQEFAQESRARGVQVVTIGAPDLYTLMHNHSRYFVGHDANAGIEWCFFCRTFLNLDDIELEEIARLERAAFHEGHCILCHQSYPIRMYGPEQVFNTYPREGIAFHSEQCPVTSGMGLSPF